MTDINPSESIHNGLPRQGPGSDSTTKALFGTIKHPNKIQRGIDMGCGTGRSTIWLAQQGIDMVAIDTSQPFLNTLHDAATRAGVANHINTKKMSIGAVSYPDESFDLVWSEGAAYFIGWARALTSWKRLLKPEGYLIATDMFWTTDSPTPELADFFKDDNVLTLEQGSEIARQSGYVVRKTYIQPDSDWFDEYYSALEERAEKFSAQPDPKLREAGDQAKQEIAIRRKYKTEYQHVGFVLQVAG
ncbi:MAG TPA: class I SAM-dependent methyltransferase [Candidatus Saccharimonadales bacterium]|nr:class I SAM-dependent methyltransferase [Candidatus Saccharimonadales bacterium]